MRTIFIVVFLIISLANYSQHDSLRNQLHQLAAESEFAPAKEINVYPWTENQKKIKEYGLSVDEITFKPCESETLHLENNEVISVQKQDENLIVDIKN